MAEFSIDNGLDNYTKEKEKITRWWEYNLHVTKGLVVDFSLVFFSINLIDKFCRIWEKLRRLYF